VAAFIQLFIKALSALPPAFEFLKKLIELAQSEIQIILDERAKGELARALEKSRREKNTCEVERVFNPNQNCDPPQR